MVDRRSSINAGVGGGNIGVSKRPFAEPEGEEAVED